MHKSGFVNIIGNPNVGKSTLMNALVGEKLSIITSKAQTTRHRILGIVNGDDFQIVFSDTPGILKPCYKLQESMMNFVRGALSDADVLLYVTDTVERDDERAGVPQLVFGSEPLAYARQARLDGERYENLAIVGFGRRSGRDDRVIPQSVQIFPSRSFRQRARVFVQRAGRVDLFGPWRFDLVPGRLPLGGAGQAQQQCGCGKQRFFIHIGRVC